MFQMSDGYTSSSPTHSRPHEVTNVTVTTQPGDNGSVTRDPLDPRVRFTTGTHSREEVSLYGTPKEEIMPNVNGSRYTELFNTKKVLCCLF